MRGKGCTSCRAVLEVGITPAYAGKSFIWLLLSYLDRDHPRLCGEKWHIGQSITLQKGSPPPMRGKDGFPFLEALALGITPAYAGKSYS